MLCTKPPIDGMPPKSTSVPSPSSVRQSFIARYGDAPFAVEMALLLLAGPALYFPSRFPAWAPYASFALLALIWVWRKWRLGVWLRRTPADWPVFFLFLVMLPVSVWVAPEPLRGQYSIPRAYILVWNFCLFWSIATHGARRAVRRVCTWGLAGAGTLLAGIALFGVRWVDKFPVLGTLAQRIPHPFLGAFAGAEAGFSPNQVAGALLYVLPWLTALGVASFIQHPRAWRQWVAPVLATVFLGSVLLLTQSRSGWLGFAVSLLYMALIGRRWGRWLLGASAMGVLVGLLALQPVTLFEEFVQARVGQAGTGAIYLVGRTEIWSRALFGIQDAPFTGLGLGVFRRAVVALYPFNASGPAGDIAHAHNFFLQTALDFGLPGLIAVLAIYLVAGFRLLSLLSAPPWWKRAEGIGLLGVLVGQTVYSLGDAVAMGSKPNFLLWYVLALAVTAERGDETGTEGTQGRGDAPQRRGGRRE